MAKFKLTPLAKTDLIDIWNYTDNTWGTNQADQYLKTIEQHLGKLVTDPQLGKSRDEVRYGYRSLLVNKHVVFYRYNKNTVEIIRILHQKMDVLTKFDDLPIAV